MERFLIISRKMYLRGWKRFLIIKKKCTYVDIISIFIKWKRFLTINRKMYLRGYSFK